MSTLNGDNTGPTAPSLPNTGTVATEADDLVEPPPEEEFWKKYNSHYECPIGFASSILALVIVVAVLVASLLYIGSAHDTKPVSITNLGGDDDAGVGSIGGGGQENPIQTGEPTPADLARPELPQDLNQVKEELAEKLKIDPTDNIPIPDNVAAAFGALDKELQDKLTGAQKGRPGGSGKGDDVGGTGVGGTGADSTRARGLRWVLRFKTTSGRDYLAQLKAMKAIVMIPVPPDNKKMIIIRDPGNPRTDEYATDADIAAQGNKIQFQDVRKESNEAIAEALRLPRVPSAFWAFFPKGLEEEMSRMEVAYQNKRAEDIKETIFQVIVTGGEARLKVVAQRLK
jgi:hypothetical protein